MEIAKPHYSASREAGRSLYVSGQLALDERRHIVGDTIEAQLSQCMANLRRVLEDAGLGLSDVVKTTVWITRRDDFAAFNAAYAAYFPENPPARSTVVCDLAAPGALIEIEAVAFRP